MTALETKGAAWYFQNAEGLRTAVAHRVHRLQLHPGYSYEDFVRGLHVGDGGRTEYRPGYLLNLVARINAEQAAAGEYAGLPHVLILDEMNRADLSRLLGECFSLLEDRGATVDLPGRSADDLAMTLRLPENLYVIGTMNLIDQSIEQVDFALRRRFLWEECRFQREDLLRVCRARWNANPVPHHPWPKVAEDFRKLVAAAASLNDAVAKSTVLGPQYEVGHTYFFDIVEFLRRDLDGAGKGKKYILWRKGSPRRPCGRSGSSR